MGHYWLGEFWSLLICNLSNYAWKGYLQGPKVLAATLGQLSIEALPRGLFFEVRS